MDPKVKEKFEDYPLHVRDKMLFLRKLVLDTATEINPDLPVLETLKWGEPSYIAKKGSTIRMDWKPRAPHQYALYFNCNTSLVETFRIVYGSLFQYEKNRAILFDLDEEISVNELKDCIDMALQYHTLKHLPLLGR